MAIGATLRITYLKCRGSLQDKIVLFSATKDNEGCCPVNESALPYGRREKSPAKMVSIAGLMQGMVCKVIVLG